MDEKQINSDFIKGGWEGSPFYELISQKIFNLTRDGFPNNFPINSPIGKKILENMDFNHSFVL